MVAISTVIVLAKKPYVQHNDSFNTPAMQSCNTVYFKFRTIPSGGS